MFIFCYLTISVVYVSVGAAFFLHFYRRFISFLFLHSEFVIFLCIPCVHLLLFSKYNMHCVYINTLGLAHICENHLTSKPYTVRAKTFRVDGKLSFLQDKRQSLCALFSSHFSVFFLFLLLRFVGMLFFFFSLLVLYIFAK